MLEQFDQDHFSLSLSQISYTVDYHKTPTCGHPYTASQIGLEFNRETAVSVIENRPKRKGQKGG